MRKVELPKGYKNIDFEKVLSGFATRIEDLRRCL